MKYSLPADALPAPPGMDDERERERLARREARRAERRMQRQQARDAMAIARLRR